MPASASSVSHHRFLKHFWERLKKHPLAHVGPGLITGVADDDPSGIATYAQAGAQFGFQMLFTMPLSFPLMVAIQSMCARLGRVTGKGLSANIKSAFPPSVLFSVVGLLLIANILNIAADVAAISVLLGLILQYSPIRPMHALFWSAVINGIVAVPLIIVIILLTSKKSVMGPFAIGWFLQWLGWFATILMGFVAIWMFVPL